MKKLIKILEKNNINLKDFDIREFKNKIYNNLKEIDIFKNDFYHQIFYFTYILKYPKTQVSIAMKLDMDQSTVSRKQKEIEKYIINAKFNKKGDIDIKDVSLHNTIMIKEGIINDNR